MKKWKRKIGFLMVILGISLIVPVLNAKAEKSTKSTVLEMEKDISSLEIDVPITTTNVGWRIVPDILFYPSVSTGLDTKKPISYFNCISRDKDEEYYENAVIWYTSNEKVLSVTEHCSGVVVIVAESEGTAILTARLGKHSTSLLFEVSDGPNAITVTGVNIETYDDMTLDKSSSKNILTVTQGEEFDLTYTIDLIITTSEGLSSSSH